MKKFLRLLTFLVMLVPFVAKAQILEPVQWTVETEKLNKNEYNIVFKAEIEDGWHLYSQNTPFGGPMPLYFEFIDTLGIERIGGVAEPKAIVHYSDIFEIDEHFFEKEAVFTQRVKLLDDAATVTGVITGQSYKEQCVPITYEFEVQLGKQAVVKEAPKLISTVTNDTIHLYWDYVIGAISYKLYYEDKLFIDNIVDNIGINGIAYNIVTPVPGTYCFTVTAVNGVGESEHSNKECAEVKAEDDLEVPAAKEEKKGFRGAIIPANATGEKTSSSTTALCEEPKYSDIFHLPHGLKGYYDYEQGLACAKAQNKPIYIDFTGHGCVNCREMEVKVWSDPRVLEILRNEYVIVALYVDDKTTLPEDEWMVNSKGEKKKTSIGRKNSAFQISKFDANAQPYYCLMGHNGELLVAPRAYSLDKDAFVNFLKQGIENFNNGVSIRNINE